MGDHCYHSIPIITFSSLRSDLHSLSEIRTGQHTPNKPHLNTPNNLPAYQLLLCLIPIFVMVCLSSSFPAVLLGRSLVCGTIASSLVPKPIVQLLSCSWWVLINFRSKPTYQAKRVFGLSSSCLLSSLKNGILFKGMLFEGFLVKYT